MQAQRSFSLSAQEMEEIVDPLEFVDGPSVIMNETEVDRLLGDDVHSDDDRIAALLRTRPFARCLSVPTRGLHTRTFRSLSEAVTCQISPRPISRGSSHTSGSSATHLMTDPLAPSPVSPGVAYRRVLTQRSLTLRRLPSIREDPILERIP